MENANNLSLLPNVSMRIENGNTEDSPNLFIQGNHLIKEIKDTSSRFVIEQKLNNGCFGSVYAGVDKSTNTPVVLKLNNEKHMNRVERNIMKELNKRKFDNFPRLIDSGKINGKHGVIMSKLG